MDTEIFENWFYTSYFLFRLKFVGTNRIAKVRYLCVFCSICRILENSWRKFGKNKIHTLISMFKTIIFRFVYPLNSFKICNNFKIKKFGKGGYFDGFFDGHL